MQSLVILLPVILLPLFFVGAGFLTSLLTGWHELAATYAFSGTFQGQRWNFRSGNMRFGSHYSGCLTVGGDPVGLYVAVLFLFRCGHPPLFIPWSEVSVRETRYFSIFLRTEFRFRGAPSIPLYFNRDLTRRLQAVAGAAWPGVPGDPGAAIQDSLRA